MIATNDISKLDEIKSKLKLEFKMFDMGEPKSFLGIEIHRDRQNHTIKLIDFLLYLVSLGWIGQAVTLANTVRPDIAYAVNVLCRNQINPADEEWKKVKRVCRYLNYSESLGLMFEGKLDDLQGFSDVSFAHCKDSITTSAFIIKLYGDTFARKTHKQPYIALLTNKAEYFAMSDACQEMI